MRELASHAGPLREARLSDDARAALLDLYAQALSRHSRPLSTETPTWSEARVDDAVLRLELRAAPGASVSIKSPSGILTLRELAVDLTTTSAEQRSAAMAERRAEA
jgi:CRP-like cAMP-binding protein